MEIEVGEYVRANNRFLGRVNKIELKGSGIRYAGELITDTIIQFNDGKVYERRVKDKDIVKHSNNIINLIEVGDYVNGYKVYKITSACIYLVGKAVQNKLTINIKTILTHEQYEQNCYKLEKEVE